MQEKFTDDTISLLLNGWCQTKAEELRLELELVPWWRPIKRRFLEGRLVTALEMQSLILQAAIDRVKAIDPAAFKEA